MIGRQQLDKQKNLAAVYSNTADVTLDGTNAYLFTALDDGEALDANEEGAMSYEQISVETRDGVTWIRLTRAERLNALTPGDFE